MSGVATPCPAAGTHCIHWEEGVACCYCGDALRIHPAHVPANNTVFVSPVPRAPLEIVCPHCRASVGAKCTEPKPGAWGGFHFVDYFHPERTALATGVA